MRSRLDSVQIELGDAIDVFENARELLRHLLHLVVRQLEASELGHVQNLVAVDHRAHVRSGPAECRAGGGRSERPQTAGGRSESGRRCVRILCAGA